MSLLREGIGERESATALRGPIRVGYLARHRNARHKESLPGRNVKSTPVGAAEREVRDHVLGNRDVAKEVSLRRHDIDARRHVGRLMSVARRQDAGSDIEVAFYIEPHAVAAPPRRE